MVVSNTCNCGLARHLRAIISPDKPPNNPSIGVCCASPSLTISVHRFAQRWIASFAGKPFERVVTLKQRARDGTSISRTSFAPKHLSGPHLWHPFLRLLLFLPSLILPCHPPLALLCLLPRLPYLSPSWLRVPSSSQVPIWQPSS
jgi:hypothetical protein